MMLNVIAIALQKGLPVQTIHFFSPSFFTTLSTNLIQGTAEYLIQESKKSASGSNVSSVPPSLLQTECTQILECNKVQPRAYFTLFPATDRPLQNCRRCSLCSSGTLCHGDELPCPRTSLPLTTPSPATATNTHTYSASNMCWKICCYGLR